MATELATLLSELKINEALAYVQNSLDQGADAMQILADARDGMEIVGDRFANGTYFIPDLIFSGEILKQISVILEPHLKARKAGAGESLGKIIIGTVRGDIHDIGKDLVVFMLDISGFEVIDLGVDVPAEKFVEAVKESGARIVGLSGFLTLTYDTIKDTIAAIQAAGLRDQVKIMIGGGQMDDQVKTYTGADAYGKDAMEAITLAKQWIGG